MTDVFLELSQGKRKVLQKVEEISQVHEQKWVEKIKGERAPKGPKGAFIVSSVNECNLAVEETYGEVVSMMVRAGTLIISLEGEKSEAALKLVTEEEEPDEPVAAKS